MPNRLIREGWLDSEAIDALAPESERFFHRLCLTADDAGRFDGRRDILRARLFPLKASLRASDVEKWLQDCAKHGLVIPYERDSKPYVQISKWQRSSPCVTSKYPWTDGSFRIEYVKRETRDGDKDFVSTSLADGIGKPSDPSRPLPARNTGDGDGGEAGNVGGKRAAPENPDAALTAADLVAEGVIEHFAKAWLLVRKTKKAPLTRAAWDAVKREAALAGITPGQAVQASAENSWQGFKAAWLKGDTKINGHHPVASTATTGDGPNLKPGDLLS